MSIAITKPAGKKLRSLGVVAVYLFGSRAQGVAGPLSDFDFGVFMEKSGNRRGDETYDALYDLLSPLCPRTLANDILDIVFLNDAPLELRFHVIRYGKVLFDASPRVRGRFEERTMNEYCDYRPTLDMFDRAILAAL